MNPLTLALAGLAGVALGGFFLRRLWWTVRRGLRPRVRRSGLSAACWLRTAIVLAGFYFVAGGIGSGWWPVCSGLSWRACS